MLNLSEVISRTFLWGVVWFLLNCYWSHYSSKVECIGVSKSAHWILPWETLSVKSSLEAWSWWRQQNTSRGEFVWKPDLAFRLEDSFHTGIPLCRSRFSLSKQSHYLQINFLFVWHIYDITWGQIFQRSWYTCYNLHSPHENRSPSDYENAIE